MNPEIQLTATDVDDDRARLNAERETQVSALAFRLWEEEGWPQGRRQEHLAEAERRLSPELASTPPSPEGLTADNDVNGEVQDTPGRPKASSSRQQTQPSQSIQTGSRQLDAESGSPSTNRRG